MTKRILLGITLGLFACNKSSSGGGTTITAASEDPNLVVAKYSGKSITLKEVDAAKAKDLAELDKKKFELRREAAEEIAIKALVKEQADKVKKTEQEWLKENIESKIQPPPEAAIQKTFDENKDRMPPGSTLDIMRPQIIEFMTQSQKREVAQQVFGELKKSSGFKFLVKERRFQVAATGPSMGPAGAKVTIVEFSDFQCPFCSRAKETVDKVMQDYAGKVRLVFRQFPLSFHAQAPKAAEASLCANEQGQFWKYHDILFGNQQKLQIEDLKEHAKTLGLDADKFAKCLDSGAMANAVKADMDAGAAVGVSGTPAFFINGSSLSGAQPYEEFKRIIDEELSDS